MIILDLFSGTGSIRKVAEKLGHTVVSVDIDEKWIPKNMKTGYHLRADILKLPMKELPEKVDFLFASPPCETYSILIRSFKKPPRNIKPPYQALTAKGRHADKMLNKTLSIIKSLQRKNKHMKWVIENPKGFMRLQPQMKKINIATTTYNNYDDIRNKPTDFFNNFGLELLPPKFVKNTPLLIRMCFADKIKIPPKLIRAIFSFI